MADPATAGPYAIVRGPNDAPGIVFVHGTRMAAAYWAPQLEALADIFRVVAVDLPGHGTRRDTPFTHQDAIATILRSAETCAGGRAIVVGHSLGGFLVMDAAAAAPERCRALVLAGSTAIARGARTWPYRLIARAVPLFPETTLTRWNDRLLRRLYDAELVEPQIAAGYGFAAVAASWEAILDRDHTKALRGYPGPVLLLNGARDHLFRSGEKRYLRACPNARLQLLARAGHMSNLDRPAEFNAAIRAFARTVYGMSDERDRECGEGEGEGEGLTGG
jgi:pimeloyl-ACP methyl ester carboxylesterase